MGYLAPPPEPAPVVVVRDIGGFVSDYRRQTAVYRAQNREVRLHECRSACTLALSLPNVCVYKTSILRFHQAYDQTSKQVDYGVSDELFQSYPPAVRARLGYLTRKYKSLTGAELIRLGVRDCNGPRDRQPQIMIARRNAPKYVPPGEGPVAKFLSKVAGNLFGSGADHTPTATIGKNSGTRIAKNEPKGQPSGETRTRVAAAYTGLPEFGPLPPQRPEDLAAEPTSASQPMQLAGGKPAAGPASQAPANVVVADAGSDKKGPPALPKIITGAYPVLPAQFSAYAPLSSLLSRVR